ncbi:MAG: hypothetical protein RIF33_11720 [Cyclobacteriaceae bacterium]
MRRSALILIFFLTASKLLARECTKGFMGKHFLSNINSFDAIVLIQAVSDPIDLEYNLVVKKTYKGNIEESETLKLGSGFCSDSIIANKGTRFILGLFDTASDSFPFELSRCLSAKIYVNGEQTYIEEGRSEWGQPRIGLTKRKLKLKRLESRIKSKIWWNNLF